MLKIFFYFTFIFLTLTILPFSESNDCLRTQIDFSNVYYKGFWEPIKQEYQRLSLLMAQKKIPASDARHTYLKNIETEIRELIDFEQKERPKKSDMEELSSSVKKALSQLEDALYEKEIVKSASESANIPQINNAKIYLPKQNDDGRSIYLYESKNNSPPFLDWYNNVLSTIEKEALMNRLNRLTQSKDALGDVGTLLSDNHGVKNITIFSLKNYVGKATRVFFIYTKSGDILLVGQVLKQEGHRAENSEARRAGERVLELLKNNPNML